MILLVEDNQRDEKLALAAFQINNIPSEKIVVAHDGVEALDFLFGNGEYSTRDVSDIPQLVLLDLKMPRLDGFQTLKRIRSEEKTRMIPVIILTTSQQQEDINTSYRLGSNSYIRKPVDFDDFIDSINKVIGYWMELNESPSLS